MGSIGIGLLGQIASLISGTIGYSVNFVTSLVKTGYKEVLQYNQESIALARQMGLNAKEAQAYSTALISRAERLGKAYGISAEQVVELQKNLSEATSRQLMLNDSQAKGLVQMNKMVGSNVANQFISEMMNGMGAQLSTVQGAVSKAYATAAKSGLNAQKVTEKIANNLSMANKLSFRDGINGLTRMAIQAEKVGMNLQSVESATGRFMELQDAIQNSAQMQMLGGSAAAMFGNPLTAAYEANYDPEAFAQRMQDSLASYAEFDAKSGMSKINGMNMDFVRNIANAMGISVDEASKIAKKQAENRYKESTFGAALGRYSQEERDFIINKSYVENGKLMMNDASGNTYDISHGKLDSKLLEAMRKYENMSDRDILENQAQSLTSINDLIAGYETSFFASIANGINNFTPNIEKIVKYVGDFLTSEIAPTIANGIIKIGHWLLDHTDEITSIASTITSTMSGVINFFKDNSGWLKVGIGTIITLLAANNAVKFVKNTKELGDAIRNAWSRSGGGGAALDTTPNSVKMNGKTYRQTNHGWQEKQGNGQWRNLNKKELNKLKPSLRAEQRIQAANTVSNNTVNTNNIANNTVKKGGAWTKVKNIWNSKLFKGASKGVKIGGGAVSAAIGVGQGIYSAVNYGSIKKDLNKQLVNGAIGKQEYDRKLKEAKTERNENIGGGIGAAIGGVAGATLGPGGAVAGALAGEWVGKYVGREWDNITNAVNDAWASTKEYGKSVWNDVKEDWRSVLNFVKEGGRSVWTSLLNLLSNIPVVGKYIEVPQEKHNSGGIVGGNSYSGDKIITGLNSGEMILNKDQQSALFNLINGLSNNISSLKGASSVQTINTSGNVTNMVARSYNEATNNGVTSYVAFNNPYSNGSSVIKTSNSNANTSLSSVYGGETLNTANNIASTLNSSLSSIYGGETLNTANNIASTLNSSLSSIYGGETLNTANNTTATSSYSNENTSNLSNYKGSVENTISNAIANTLSNSISNALLSSVYGGNTNNATTISSYSNGSTSNLLNNSNGFVSSTFNNVFTTLFGNVLNRFANTDSTIVGGNTSTTMLHGGNTVSRVIGGNTSTTMLHGGNTMSNIVGGNTSTTTMSNGNTLNTANNTTATSSYSNENTSNLFNNYSKLIVETFNNAFTTLFGNVLNRFANTSSTSSIVGGNTSTTMLHGGNTVSSIVGGNTSNNIASTLNSSLSSAYGGETLNTANNTAVTSNIIDSLSNNISLLSHNASNVITNALEAKNDVKAKPVGEKEYIYMPQRNTSSSTNETSVTVKDINININGTIKLDGGKFIKSINADDLLNDLSFISSLKELIKQSINNDMNGGRFMNDLATIRGGSAPLSIIGR